MDQEVLQSPQDYNGERSDEERPPQIVDKRGERKTEEQLAALAELSATTPESEEGPQPVADPDSTQAPIDIPLPGTENMTEEQKALLMAQAQGDDSSPLDEKRRHVLTAFVVVVNHDGSVNASSEFSFLDDILMAREATFMDMHSASGHVMKDVSNAELTGRIMQGIQAQANAAREAIQAQQVQSMMQQGGPRMMRPR